MATLDDLLQTRDRPAIEAILLSALQSAEFPVSDWNSGGVVRTILKMVATGILDREQLIRFIVSGGFLDLASTLTDSEGNPVEDWAEALAEQLYNLPRAASTFTQKSLTLTCASGAGPYTRAAGELRAISQAGNYYVLAESATIPDGGSVVATFQAEQSGVVTDVTGTIDQLATPLAGVTVIDVATDFSVPVQSWNGSGTIEASSGTHPPSPARTIAVRIYSSGDIGVAQFTLTVYRGTTATVTGPFAIAATYATGDATLTFTDGAAGTVSFIAGDTWSVTTPGEPTVQTGSDAESLASLAERCRDRWPALSLIPTESRYAAWVRECSSANYLGINRITTRPSTEIAGRVNVYVADSIGAPGPTVLTLLQQYLDVRTTEIERATVLSAVSVEITVTGFVKIKRNLAAAAKIAVKAAWNSYLASVPIGGEPPDYIVKVSKLDEILMAAGAYNTTTLQINYGGTDVDLVLLSNQVAAASTAGTDDLTWNEVP